MPANPFDDLRPASPAWAAALSDLVPDLRLAAIAIAGRGAEADSVLCDALLEALVADRTAGRRPDLRRLVSVMRTAHFTRTRVADRASGYGSGARAVRRRAAAAAVQALPPDEREAFILVSLLQVAPDRAAGLLGTAPDCVRARARRALRRFAPASRPPAATPGPRAAHGRAAAAPRMRPPARSLGGREVLGGRLPTGDFPAPGPLPPRGD